MERAALARGRVKKISIIEVNVAKIRSISAQFQYAVRQSAAYGQSKYDERHKGAGNQSKIKTYSYKTMKARIDVAKQFGKFVQEHHPEVQMARDITFDIAREYLEHKANEGCSHATLQGYTADIRTIFRVCDKCYPTFGHVTDNMLREQIRMPEAHPELVKDSHRDAIGMTRPDFEKLRDSFSRTSNGFKGCIIQEATGARAEGCCNLKGDDIHIENGRCWVHLDEKGGLQRDVEVFNAQYIKNLQQLKNQAKDGYVLNHRGNPIKPESLSKAYRDHLKKLDTQRDYRGTNSHAIRKLWANERYHEYRQNHTKLETVQYINVQLGHGADRDEALLAHYVDNLN